MPTNPTPLRDAIVLWRAELETTSTEPERRALEIAIKALDLCLRRGVVPLLEGHGRFVTMIVIPPRSAAITIVETSRHSHGPVVVDCELHSLTMHEALGLVDDALRASEHVTGWAPLYVRRWVGLLRDESGPRVRLVVAPDEESDG